MRAIYCERAQFLGHLIKKILKLSLPSAVYREKHSITPCDLTLRNTSMLPLCSLDSRSLAHYGAILAEVV